MNPVNVPPQGNTIGAWASKPRTHLIGYGPLSRTVNDITSNVEVNTSNVSAASDKLMATSNLAYDSSNMLYPTVGYMDDIVTIATNSSNETEFSSNLYYNFMNKATI